MYLFPSEYRVKHGLKTFLVFVLFYSIHVRVNYSFILYFFSLYNLFTRAA